MNATDPNQDGRSDFDFYVGRWRIFNRRLRERLVGSTDWEDFTGLSTAQKILGGLGNFDETSFTRESGRLDGMTLRLFNLASKEWSLYWSDSATGVLFPPMVGKFKNGRGLFYAQEQHRGATVYSRFIWSGITATTCHWEQALSEDGGQTWETNWTMDFERV